MVQTAEFPGGRMLQRVKTFFGGWGGKRAAAVVRSEPALGSDRPALQAATGDLPPPNEPKRVKKGQQVLPSHLKTAKPSTTAALTLEERRLANLDITTYRTSNTSRQIIRDFVGSSPDLSAAVKSYVRVGIPSNFTAFAKNLDGTFNPEATNALAQVLTRMNVLNDYALGFDDNPSIRSLCESWAAELMMYGSCSGELVLDKVLLPSHVQPLSTTQIKFYPSSDGKRKIPKQEISGTTIELDIPTFFYTSLDQDLLNPYSDSPIETAIPQVIFNASFMNDLRRVVRRAIHPRVDVEIDEETFLKSVPLDVRNDQDKFDAYMEQAISNLAEMVNGLEPEDAFVHFSSVGVEIKDHGNTNLSSEYQFITDYNNSKMAAGAKVLPTILGNAEGASNIASSEVLLFMKSVEGAVWSKLNEMLSKILTLAVRLLGHDVTVQFMFDPIDLRPTNELESFKAQRQSRILELLSLGFLTDEEASIQLTGNLPPAGFKRLSGTMFFSKKVEPAGDGYNGESNSGSTMNQNLKPDAPTGGARGSNTKSKGKE